ncbi:MAG: transposase [Flavobacteriales bacterium]|nr:transposase [Flavobacteriales bacterium]
MGIKRVKNDKVDALRIAQYARTFREKTRLFTAQNLKLDKLKHLLTRRQHLVRVRAMYKKHLSDLNRYMDKDIKKAFDQLDKRLIVASGSCRDTRRATDRGTDQADDITSEQYNLLLTMRRRPTISELFDRAHRWLPSIYEPTRTGMSCWCSSI